MKFAVEVEQGKTTCRVVGLDAPMSHLFPPQGRSVTALQPEAAVQLKTLLEKVCECVRSDTLLRIQHLLEQESMRS